MTTALGVLAYLAIGFGGVGALVWWHPEWWYDYTPPKPLGLWGPRPATVSMRWDYFGLQPWPVFALAWPLVLVCYGLGLGPALAWTALEEHARTKLERLRAIDAEVETLRKEREQLLKEAGL